MAAWHGIARKSYLPTAVLVCACARACLCLCVRVCVCVICLVALPR